MVLRVMVQESPSYRNTEIYAGEITSWDLLQNIQSKEGGRHRQAIS